MQVLAPVGSIAATEQVRKLYEGYFLFNGLGPTKVKGVSEPVNVYEVTGLGALRTRLQRAVGRGLTKFVGREHEMEAMKRAAEQVPFVTMLLLTVFSSSDSVCLDVTLTRVTTSGRWSGVCPPSLG